MGIAATVAAAWFAYWSIRKSGKRAKHAADALVRERRLDFELDSLKELAELLTGFTLIGTLQAARALRLSMFPHDEFKMCRDAFGVNGPEAYQDLKDSVQEELGNDILQAKMPGGKSVQTRAQQEVLDAIPRKLSARPATPDR